MPVRVNVALVLPLAVVALAACGTQYDSQRVDRQYDDLRSLVVEQRRAIEELRQEQQGLRATVDEMQYGRRVAGAGSEGDNWAPGGRRPTPEVPLPGANPYGYDESDSDSGLGDDTTYAPPQVPVSAGGAGAVTSPPASAAASDGRLPTVPQDLAGTAYDAGVRSLVAGDHDEAIQHFRDFIHENPSSRYADDAQYWIGEAYFRKGQYHRAIIELNQVAIAYGSSDRAAAALLRQAEAFRIVGDRVDARLSLQKVINRYPGTDEAARASRMLSEIGG